MTNCVFCNSLLPETPDRPPDAVFVPCSTCGHFEISESVLSSLSKDGSDKMHLYAGALRENYIKTNQAYRIDSLDALLNSVRIPRTPLEKIDKYIQYFEYLTTFFGEQIDCDVRTDFPLAFAKGPDEFFRLLEGAFKLQYINAPQSLSRPTMSVGLSIDGARRVDELRKSGVHSDQAFVAMWFDAYMDKVFEDGFKPALETTGFQALRIDKKEHNNKIDDEIIAEINKSGLLIADFTGHRGGVYFEAGYALGLGIPVIFTCKENEIGSAHFDTRQYSHIVWKESEDLRVQLIRRIQATQPNRIHPNRIG